MPEDSPSKEADAVKEAVSVVQLGIDLSKLPDGLTDALNLQEETDERIKESLQALADYRDSVLLCFIGSYGAKRITAYRTQSASIGRLDELSIERVTCEAIGRANGKKLKLMLLLGTDGGTVNSSYAVAKMLRENFSHISVFVPHVAASGGTLIALAANEIVMGMNSQLSPIDTQLSYAGTRVSAQSIGRAIETLKDLLEKLRLDEIPFVYQEMVGKLDPILWEEWNASLYQVGSYARELLTAAGYDKKTIDNVIYRLVWTPFRHDYYLGRDKAKERLKLNVKEDNLEADVWAILKSWHSLYVLKAEDRHIIRYVFPKTLAVK